MEQIKTEDLMYLIPINMFDKCILDDKTRQWISKEYRREDVTKNKSVYYLEKFAYHLNLFHNISLRDYCINHLKINWNKHKNGDYQKYRITGQGIEINKYGVGGCNKDNHAGIRKNSEKMAIERKGSANPMFGAKPWNKGLDRNNPIINKIAEDRTGLKMDESSKERMRQRRKENPLKARHTTKHSDETKAELRKNTARLWAEGRFNRTSSIHIKMREFLETLKLKEKPTEEYQEIYYSIDFAFINVKIAIETDGDYYHINPQFYPDGPKDKIQRRNAGRDKAKNKFLTNRGWTILRYWECEINSGSYKEKLLCKLKELNLLED